jgi:multiple sugar transport system ATP-binding protein
VRLKDYVERPVCLGIRPENIGSRAAEEQEEPARIKACVDVVEPMGSETYLYLSADDRVFVFRIESHRRPHVGDEVRPAVLIEKSHFFDVETEKSILNPAPTF